jgi:uncharacterized protein YecE (DUF72 family)
MKQTKILVGMGGWTMFPFTKRFYPSKLPPGQSKLNFYSNYFDSLEVNSTFYNTHFTSDHVQDWIDDVSHNPDFTFTVKLFRGYTHSFDATKDDIRRVYAILDRMASSNKLGGIVIQFPSSFKNDKPQREYLYRLSHAFRQYRMFLEVRHGSWNSPFMYNFFQENRFHLVNVDLPRLKSHIPFNKLSWDGAAYFRMMGRNRKGWVNPWRLEADGKHMVSDRYNYLYSDEELEELASAIRSLRNTVKEIFVVFHNDPNAHSIYNGFRLRHLLETEKELKIPSTTVRAFPSLREISSSSAFSSPLFSE